MDRHFLYEATMQSPGHLVPFLRALHGGEPRALGEDFCGTALLARAWVAQVPAGEAQAIDLDEEVLARAGVAPVLTLVRADLRTELARPRAPVDVVYAGNFSIGYLHAREELLDYLRRTRARLAPNGIFVCDTYGGGAAWRTGAVLREHFLPGSLRVRATWEQRAADPLSARVENAVHFRVDREGDVVFEERDAFVYRWRVWSLPELADALREAGFASSEVYAHLGEDPAGREGRPTPVRDPSALGDPGERWAACVVGRR